jgi:hypothetical protein
VPRGGTTGRVGAHTERPTDAIPNRSTHRGDRSNPGWCRRVQLAAAQVTVTPDLSSFASDLTAALGPALAAAQSSFDGIGSSATAAGDEIKSGIGGGVTSVADIVKGVAIGTLIADGIEAGVQIAVNAIQTIATALPNLG